MWYVQKVANHVKIALGQRVDKIMNIQILSRLEMCHLLMREPDTHDVIIIRSPSEDKPRTTENDFQKAFRESVNHAFDSMNGLWKSSLILEFDDYWKPHHLWKIPSEQDILNAISFTKEKANIHIACAGGISRSSALGYVITRSKMTRENSLQILNSRHRPNDLVLELGGKILGLDLKKEVTDAGFPLISWG